MRRPTTLASSALVFPVLLTGCLACAIPVAAQTASSDDRSTVVSAASLAPTVWFADQRPPYVRPRAREPIGARIFGAVDVEHMLAKQSFGATVGTATLLGFGGGVDVIDLNGGGLFFRGAVSVMGKDGTRSDATISNGIALQVRMVPIDLCVGWRFNHMTRANDVTPFVGGGALLLHYSETTPAGDSTDNTTATFKGFEVFGGVDLLLGSSITVAPEVDYRSLPSAIGTGGLSQVFNETNLGGVAFRVTVGVRLGRR